MSPLAFASMLLRYGVSLALLALMWAVAVYVFDIPSYLLPEPVAVIRTLFTEWPSLR